MDKKIQINIGSAPMADSVYTTGQNNSCPTCRKPKHKCRCNKQKPTPSAPSDGIVRVSRQTKGRKGKGVTLITGLTLPPDELKELAKTLKQKCGSGGAIKDGIIEIQGDQRDHLVELLTNLGYKAKRAGG